MQKIILKLAALCSRIVISTEDFSASVASDANLTFESYLAGIPGRRNNELNRNISLVNEEIDEKVSTS